MGFVTTSFTWSFMSFYMFLLHSLHWQSYGSFPPRFMLLETTDPPENHVTPPPKKKKQKKNPIVYPSL